MCSINCNAMLPQSPTLQAYSSFELFITISKRFSIVTEHAKSFFLRVIVINVDQISVDAHLFTNYFGVASLDLGAESFDLVFGVSMDLGAPSLEPRGLGVVSFLELELGAFIP